MKTKSIITVTAAMLALCGLIIGCSTTKSTENLLSAAGFRMMPATTPAQQSHLQTLPPDKVTTVVRDGKTYFVFPDKKQQVLYVGQQQQFDEYQKLRLQNQMAQEQVQAAEANAGSDFAPWGGWGGAFVEPAPMIRR